MTHPKDPLRSVAFTHNYIEFIGLETHRSVCAPGVDGLQIALDFAGLESRKMKGVKNAGVINKHGWGACLMTSELSLIGKESPTLSWMTPVVTSKGDETVLFTLTTYVPDVR